MKVHLTTLGCPKNQVDSELMLGRLAAAGLTLVERPEEADCLIVNTCAFIDRAREESVHTILELAEFKRRGRCRSLIVTGCLMHVHLYGKRAQPGRKLGHVTICGGRDWPETPPELVALGLPRVASHAGSARRRGAEMPQEGSV